MNYTYITVCNELKLCDFTGRQPDPQTVQQQNALVLKWAPMVLSSLRGSARWFSDGKTESFVLRDGGKQTEKKLAASIMITESFHPLLFFRKYLQVGYLPIIVEGEDTYLMKLNKIINTIVDTDLAYIASYNSGTAIKVKKLIGVIAESVPFKPNIAALARKLDLSRDSVYQYIYQLDDARLLNTISLHGKGVSTLQKPEKIFLENTNLVIGIPVLNLSKTVEQSFDL